MLDVDRAVVDEVDRVVVADVVLERGVVVVVVLADVGNCFACVGAQHGC